MQSVHARSLFLSYRKAKPEQKKWDVLSMSTPQETSTWKYGLERIPFSWREESRNTCVANNSKQSRHFSMYPGSFNLKVEHYSDLVLTKQDLLNLIWCRFKTHIIDELAWGLIFLISTCLRNVWSAKRVLRQFSCT